MIAARFWVTGVHVKAASQGERTYEVFLAPVIRGSDDSNINWSKYTPSGEFRFIVTQQEVGLQFLDAIGSDVAINMELLTPVVAE